MSHEHGGLAAAAGSDGRIYAIGGFDQSCGCAECTVEAYSGFELVGGCGAPPTARGRRPPSPDRMEGSTFSEDWAARVPSMASRSIPGFNSWTSGAPDAQAREAKRRQSPPAAARFMSWAVTTRPPTIWSRLMSTPNGDNWTTGAPMPSPIRHGGSASALTVGFMEIGGATATGYTGSVEAYDLVHGFWITSPSMPAPDTRSPPSRRNKIYAVGGVL